MMSWKAVFENPVKDAGPPYTLEDVNRLTGSIQHRKTSPYDSLAAAEERAQEKVRGMRSFAEVNVLDRRGAVVKTFKGER